MKNQIIEKIKNAETHIDIMFHVSDACEHYKYEGSDWSMSYGEEADSCEEDNPEIAEVMRAAESRWFEVE